MKTVLALIVAATLGLSAAAFAADTVAPSVAPMATTTHSAPANTMHHKKAKKSMKYDTIKNMNKTAPEQKAQTSKKHHKVTHSHKAPTATPAAK